MRCHSCRWCYSLLWLLFFSLLDQCFSLSIFFFSSRRRHTRCLSDWSSDVCSSDLLWYATFVAVLLVTFTIFLYALISRNLYTQLDEGLSRQVTTAAGLFKAELAESPSEPVSAASEAVSQMRWNNSALAIFKGTQLLAVTEPKQSKELTVMAAMPVTTTSPTFVWVPEFGPKRARAAIVPIAIGEHEYRSVAFAPLDSISSQLSDLRRIFWIVLPLTLLAAG